MSENSTEIKKLTSTLHTLNLTMVKFIAQQEIKEELLAEVLSHKASDNFVRDERKDHEENCPARKKLEKPSLAPQQYDTKMNAFFNALGPFLFRWGLPILGALGVGYGVQKEYNTTEAAPLEKTAPADNGK